jgi:hypothetical protein
MPKVSISSSLKAEALLHPEGSVGSNRSTIEINPLEIELDRDAEPWKESSLLSMSLTSAYLTFLVLPYLAVSATGL